MEIDFSNKTLKKLCEIEREAVKELGSDSARKLRNRLADLEAVSHVSELVAGRPHALNPDDLREYSVALADGKCLVFQPNHDEIPLDKNNKTDWSRVNKVKIVYIGDYHKPKQKRKIS